MDNINITNPFGDPPRGGASERITRIIRIEAAILKAQQEYSSKIKTLQDEVSGLERNRTTKIAEFLSETTGIAQDTIQKNSKIKELCEVSGRLQGLRILVGLAQEDMDSSVVIGALETQLLQYGIELPRNAGLSHNTENPSIRSNEFRDIYDDKDRKRSD